MKKSQRTKQNIFLEALGRLFFIRPSIPQIIQIEVTNRCNLDCKMCPRKFLEVEYRDMDFEIFKRVVKKLSGVYEIILTGWGEPLCHPQIFQMIKFCHDLGFKTRLTTNGVLLDKIKADQIIETGLDEIAFSVENINPSSQNEWGHINVLQIENIKNFVQQKNRPRITLQTTLHKNRGDDIFEIIKFGKEIGAERINLERLDIRFNKNLSRPNFQEEKSIVERGVQLGDDIGVGVECLHHSLSKGFSRQIFKLIKNFLHQRGKYCFRIYDYIYININGGVTPCCSLPHYKLDSILDSSLKEIWNSEKFKKFRKNQKIVCGKCDVAYIKQISQY